MQTDRRQIFTRAFECGLRRGKWPTVTGWLLGLLLALGGQAVCAAPIADEVLSAIVTIHAEVPASARTARFLGTERDGSGVVIDTEGHILTVGYLIIEASSVEIMLNGNRRVQATVIGNDYRTGFGLLRATEPLDVTPMSLGQSSQLTERTELLVVSDSTPASIRPTLVTSRREFAGSWEYLLEDAIFTAPPHPHYAGAALIGAEGKLLGIGSLLVNDVLPGRQALTGNMFIPVDRLKPILEDLIRKGRPAASPQPWLGLFTEEFRDKLIIMSVAPGGPAEQAEVHANDLVLKVAGKPIKDQADFYRKIWALGDAGADIPLTLLQGTEIKEIVVHSSDRDSYFRTAPSPKKPDKEKTLQST